MPSVEDNTKFKCVGCGSIYDFPTPMDIEDCRICGHPDYEAIRITLVCDFCSRTAEVNWSYPCGRFAMEPIGPGLPSQAYDDDWAACDTCKNLIETGQREALIDRNISYDKMKMQLSAEQEQELRKLVTALHDQFFQHRQGEPTRIKDDER